MVDGIRCHAQSRDELPPHHATENRHDIEQGGGLGVEFRSSGGALLGATGSLLAHLLDLAE